MHRSALALLLLMLAGAGCAPTTSSSAAPVEVLVVLSDGEERSLLLVPTDATDSITRIPLGPGAGRPTTLAVRERVALVGLAEADQVQVVDLVTHESRIVSINSGGDITAVGFADDGTGFAVTPQSGRLTRFDPATGATIQTTYPTGPRGTTTARGRLFVLFGSRLVCTPESTACTPEESWLSPYGPGQLPVIPMLGRGNPVGSALAQDGTLYVLNRGGGTDVGTISAIDPVKDEEVASYGGFGLLPSYIAFDGVDRLLVASQAEGLMVFNTRERRVERGAGAGIPLPRPPRALVTDAIGRIYVVASEGCGGTATGTIRVFGRDLVEGRTIAAGTCPVAAAVTEIPSGISPE